MRNRSFLFAAVFAAGCASSTPPAIDMNEPRRVVGTENAVRIDAQVYGETLTINSAVPVKYEITNQRETAIAFADLTPDVTYDPETQIVTVGLGSEVPGNEMVPRLIRIPPGQKKSFSTVARVQIRPVAAGSMAPTARLPRGLRLKVSFLGDTEPFLELIDIPERAVHNPKLADSLFTAWLERNETVYTNAVPMRWSVTAEPDAGAATGRRRRRG